jgi:hypothetical protein
MAAGGPCARLKEGKSVVAANFATRPMPGIHPSAARSSIQWSDERTHEQWLFALGQLSLVAQIGQPLIGWGMLFAPFYLSKIRPARARARWAMTNSELLQGLYPTMVGKCSTTELLAVADSIRQHGVLQPIMVRPVWRFSSGHAESEGNGDNVVPSLEDRLLDHGMPRCWLRHLAGQPKSIWPCHRAVEASMTASHSPPLMGNGALVALEPAVCAQTWFRKQVRMELRGATLFGHPPSSARRTSQ